MTQPALITRTITVHPELPEHVRRSLAGRQVSIPLPPQVRRRMRQPEKIRGSEHAEKYRRVVDGAHTGPWRHEYAPHTVKIMDTFTFPWTREVWFCGVEQSGKTNTMLNCIGWAIDCDPGNIFYLMPTEDTSNKVIGIKMKPTLEQTPRYARYLSSRRDDTSLTKIAFNHGVTLLPAWANSPSSMATFTAKHCFGDEVDKYPQMSGKEADPITLLKKRNRNYKGRFKRFFASTPAGVFIHKGMLACHQVWEFRVKCPECDELIRMDTDHLIIPAEATADNVDQLGATYACNACGSEWSDQARETAIRTGNWICTKGADVSRPAKIGFHHRAWECLDVPLVEIAAAWLKAKDGDHAARVAWANGYEAIDHEDEKSDRKEENILRLVDPHLPTKIVPPDTSTIIIKADTQQTGFMYQVIACGYGDNFPIALIDHGFVETFSALKEIEQQEYQDAEGNTYLAHAGIIDSGGGTNPYQPKHSRTSEVYEFCRINKFWRPVKGRRDQATPWSITKLDYFPSRDGKKKPIQGGLNLYTINVTHYKNQLASKLCVDPGNPGAIRLHAGVAGDGPNSGSKYAAQLCAEYRDERGYWECPRGKPNHFWDCWVYGFAACDILGVRRKKPTAQQSPPRQERRVYSKGV